MVSNIGNPNLMWKSQGTPNNTQQTSSCGETLLPSNTSRQTDDMLMTIPLASSGGFSGRAGNVGVGGMHIRYRHFVELRYLPL